MSTTRLPDLSHNRLLCTLPPEDLQRLLPEITRVELPLGQVLSAPGEKIRHLVFPSTAIVSLLSVMEDGGAVEAAAVGHEGVVGVSAFLGGGPVQYSSVVHTAGWGWRLPAARAAEAFARSAEVARVLLHYTHELMAQMAQTAACMRHHSVEQQLCRWLLLSLDRLRGSELVMTQERIALMLGVRREGVTCSALRLQRAGLIHYARGRISVLDRTGIEQRSCECYAALATMCQRLLPDAPLQVMGAPR